METYRLKNIAILILLLLNAFLLMLLGYQYMQSQQSDADTVVQLRELFESNQLTLSESVDPLQPALTPMALSRSTGTEADMAAALLGGEAVGASQGGGIYSYTAAAGSLQFRAGGSFDSAQLSRPVEDIAAFVRSFCDDFGYQDVDLQLSGGSGTATACPSTSAMWNECASLTCAMIKDCWSNSSSAACCDAARAEKHDKSTAITTGSILLFLEIRIFFLLASAAARRFFRLSKLVFFPQKPRSPPRAFAYPECSFFRAAHTLQTR